MAKGRRRRWERPKPRRPKRRRLERVILGAGMGVAAAILERRVVKSLKRKGVTETDLRREGPHDATAEPSPR